MSKLKECREKLKLNQACMGTLLGLHPQTISKVERGLLTLSPSQATIVSFISQGSYEGRDIAGEVCSNGAVYTLCSLVYKSRIQP